MNKFIKKTLGTVLAFVFCLSLFIGYVSAENNYVDSAFSITKTGDNYISGYKPNEYSTWKSDDSISVNETVIGVRVAYSTSSGGEPDYKPDGVNKISFNSINFLPDDIIENQNIQFLSSSSKAKALYSNIVPLRNAISLSELCNIISCSASNFSFDSFQTDVLTYISTGSYAQKRGKIVRLLNLALDGQYQMETENLKDMRTNGHYDLFIAYEPLIIVKVGQQQLVGTPSQILQYYYQNDRGYNGAKNSSCSSEDNTIDANGDGNLDHPNGMGYVFCEIAQIIYNYGSCASVVDSSLINATKKVGFTQTEYFGKYAPDANKNFGGLCTTHAGARDFISKLADEGETVSGGGIGLGIIWMDDSSVIDGTEVPEMPDVPETPEVPETPDVPEPDVYKCTVSWNLGTCKDNNNISYSDYVDGNDNNDEYWNNCVFNDNGVYDIATHKTSAAGNLTYFEPNLGDSEYCPVYCIESVTANFGKNNSFTVKAGGKFSLPTSVVSGSRTCRTKVVDWDKFEKDLKKAYGEINNAVSDLNYAETFNENISDGKWEPTSETCGPDVYTSGVFEKNDITDEYINNPDAAKETYGDIYQEGDTYYTYCFIHNGLCTRKIGDSFCDPNKIYASSNSCVLEGTTGYTLYKWSQALPTFNNKDVENISNTYCSSDPTPSAPKYDLAKFEKKVNEAINAYDGYIERMKKCYTWNEDNIYRLETDAWVQYSNGIYSNNDKLTLHVNSNSVTDNSTCESKSITKYVYTNGNLTTTDEEVKSCTIVEKTKQTSITFSLNSETYRYVLKNPNGMTLQSINPLELQNYANSTFKQNYIDIGYGNLPVPFNTLAGTYTYTIGYINLGHDSTPGVVDFTPVDNILESLDTDGDFYSGYKYWTCEYNVSQGIITKGVDVIYREIDLANPFPNIDGKGRNTGENWCSMASCDGNNSVVSTYILDNRGVTGNEVYNKEPMYSFTMTPSDIIQIRRYNNKNEYTSLTGTLDSVNYDYKCKDGTGKQCISDYLTKLIEMMDGTGVCSTSDVRTTTSTKFESCRY